MLMRVSSKPHNPNSQVFELDQICEQSFGHVGQQEVAHSPEKVESGHQGEETPVTFGETGRRNIAI